MANSNKRTNSTPELANSVVARVPGAGDDRRTLAGCVKRPRRSTEENDAASSRSNCFPRDIAFSILQLLPATFLSNSGRLVCKQWNEIISDPLFVRAHTQLHLLLPSSLRIFVQDVDLRYAKHMQAYYLRTHDAVDDNDTDIDSDSDSESDSESDTTKLMLPFPATILDSCNGLLLLHHVTIRKELRVVNFATREIVTLPPLLEAGVRVLVRPYAALAYVPSSGQYKVVYVSLVSNSKRAAYLRDAQDALAHSRIHKVKVLICTLGVDKTWRTIDFRKDITLMGKGEQSLLLCQPLSTTAGYIYWLNFDHYMFGLALDVDAETMHRFTAPKDYKLKGIHTFYSIKMDTGVALVGSRRNYRNEDWKVWEMIDPKNGTWGTSINFNTDNMQRILLDQYYYRMIREKVPFSISLRTGDLWLYSGVDGRYALVCYNLKTVKLRFIDFVPYVEWPNRLALPQLHVNSLISLKNL